ncbi:PRC-barrel domain-containing protein [Inconstantimicrobium mannanitabidum]|uniref:Photosystem reaction center subunit H n=1 Tax=Inconstantimicrobium mannanitabidum TaxID=1604901 RepID=A0ACB5RBM6_9CLOT|nr:PRC-barrel domain-containing protein [Clostridium sp. TW13]GKX66623.1 photosystem reaction center subunit H [Clostridium sp. TW13]
MLRKRDLLNNEVFFINGKKVGVVKEILVDFARKKVIGLEVSYLGILSHKVVCTEDIISIDKKIIINKFSNTEGINLSKIMDLDIIDKKGELKGNVEDIIVSKDDFSIEGLICTSGFFRKILEGKTIFTLDTLILGEDNILYFGDYKVTLKSMPHKLIRDDNCDR